MLTNTVVAKVRKAVALKKKKASVSHSNNF